MPSTPTPKAVARTLIEMAAKKGVAVTNLKLQKLLYFAHGFMLAQHGRPLIGEPFEAWQYGPVVESLYHDLKIFGTGRIGPKDGFVPVWPELPASALEEREAIGAVLDQLGGNSASELIRISHDANGPWHAVFKANTKNIRIEDSAIEAYFKTVLR